MAFSNRCPKCNRNTLRIIVSLYLNIPAKMYARLNKQALRNKDVKIDGAGWPTAAFICNKCRFFMPGLNK